MVGRAAEPELKLGISPAKTPRPQRSENNSKQFFQDNLSSLRNLAYFAPWRESSLLIASFMSNNKCLHLRGTTTSNKAGRGNTRRGGGSTAAAGSMDDSMGALPPRLPLRWPRHTRPREPRYGARRRQTTVASRACR